MGFNKALFYPTIDISNEDWLKNAILFWDEINTIVPSNFDTPYKQQTTQYLSDQGVLKALHVNPDQNLINSLTSDTLNYLKTNEGVILLTQNKGINSLIHSDKLPREVSQLFNIHPDKLPYEIQNQLRNNLSKDGWFKVDSNFAKFYMTILANKICEQKGIALLTDDQLTSNFTDVVRLDNQIAISERDNNTMDYVRNKRHIHLASGLMTNLIIRGIKISKSTTLEDVIKFKSRHQDELGLFRVNVGKLTKDMIKDVSFENLQQQIQDVYNDEFLPSYNNFKKSLDSSGIKWTADNFMKIAFFSTTATSIPLALLGVSTPQALLAGAGISLVASLTSYNIEKNEKLRNNPYSYLLTVNKSF